METTEDGELELQEEAEEQQALASMRLCWGEDEDSRDAGVDGINGNSAGGRGSGGVAGGGGNGGKRGAVMGDAPGSDRVLNGGGETLESGGRVGGSGVVLSEPPIPRGGPGSGEAAPGSGGEAHMGGRADGKLGTGADGGAQGLNPMQRRQQQLMSSSDTARVGRHGDLVGPIAAAAAAAATEKLRVGTAKERREALLTLRSHRCAAAGRTVVVLWLPGLLVPCLLWLATCFVFWSGARIGAQQRWVMLWQFRTSAQPLSLQPVPAGEQQGNSSCTTNGEWISGATHCSPWVRPLPDKALLTAMPESPDVHLRHAVAGESVHFCTVDSYAHQENLSFCGFGIQPAFHPGQEHSSFALTLEIVTHRHVLYRVESRQVCNQDERKSAHCNGQDA
eukprot:1157435-Pelagomonas_calceolata.AAC.7